MSKYPFDDWGALLLSNFMMALVPSNYFMNAFYVLTGALSAVLLFRLGKSVMPVSYAYLAALAYSTSSYLILFHCTYLKESFFTFLVVCAFYFFYEVIAHNKKKALIGVLFFLAIMVFFRPVVVAFLLMAFVAYYAVTMRGSAVSLFLYGALAVGIVVSLAFMQTQLDSYTSGGNTEEVLAESGSANYSGGFNFFVGWFASLFGPFPTIFPAESVGPVPMNFYGAGLIYKLFIVIPLWAGVFWAIKRFDLLMIPVIIFVLAEIAGAAFVLASFELRKVMLHMPFIYVIAFYGFYQNEKNELSKTLTSFMEFSGYAFAIGVLMLWTVIRVK
jgi:4-amino-4-deoxy-L-arabinose transferase-like glycosyltransferase